MLLSDAACRTAKPTATAITKLSDGRGLQLWVHPNGSKLWRLAYRFGRKQKLLSLGPYPTVSLSDARDEREKAKKLLVKGIDPSEERKIAKAQQLAPPATFRSIAGELLALQTRNGRAEVTLEKTTWLLEFAYPTIGSKLHHGNSCSRDSQDFAQRRKPRAIRDCASSAIDHRPRFSICGGNWQGGKRSNFCVAGHVGNAAGKVPRRHYRCQGLRCSVASNRRFRWSAHDFSWTKADVIALSAARRIARR